MHLTLHLGIIIATFIGVPVRAFEECDNAMHLHIPPLQLPNGVRN